LIFENLWFRAAGLALGNSVWSIALVTAAFMGGLGLGNWWAACWWQRISHPRRQYVLVEAVIAVSGLAAFLLLFHGHDAIAARLAALSDAWVWLQFGRFLLGFVALLIPATAIGLTLPLLVGLRVGLASGFGPNLGRLYAFNTLGAVLGTVLAEWCLVAWLGLHGAALVAALLNLGAAAAIGFGLRGLPDLHTGSVPPTPEALD